MQWTRHRSALDLVPICALHDLSDVNVCVRGRRPHLCMGTPI
jgi:hypothetical protein